MPAREKVTDVDTDSDIDADSDQGDDIGPPPPTGSVVAIPERRLWRIEREQSDQSKMLGEIVEMQRETVDLQRETLEVQKTMATTFGRLADVELQPGVVRLAVEKTASLFERALAPDAIIHVVKIAGWVGITAICIVAITYGVGLSGYGFTIGNVGVTAPTEAPGPVPVAVPMPVPAPDAFGPEQ